MKKVLFALLVVLNACGSSDQDKANEYYNRFTAIIVPYANGTETILTDMQRMLREQLKASGDFQLSADDSVQQQALIKQFETLANKTLNDLQQMDELEGADLKTAGIEYVLSTTTAVVGTYREIVLPMQRSEGSPDPKVLDSLSDKYSDQLAASNDKFGAAQMEFLEGFRLLEK